MKVLLRDTMNGLFFVAERCWTGSRGEARDFKTSIAAIRTAHQYDLYNVEVVFVFGAESKDICVSVHGEVIPGGLEAEGGELGRADAEGP
jgi:hypothetical protein